MTQAVFNAAVDLALKLGNPTDLSGKYSIKDSNENLRSALKEMIGSDTVDYKTWRRNNTLLCEFIEITVPQLVGLGLQGDEFFTKLVEDISVPMGDKPVFEVEKGNLYKVTKVADGINRVRRQRIEGKQEVRIDTHWYIISIYEEFSLFLAGRRDWATFIRKVSESMEAMYREQTYNLLTGLSKDTVGLGDEFFQSGTFDPEKLIDLIMHVEANGDTAYIVGDKLALSKVKEAEISESAKAKFHNIGYYGNFAGTEMISIKNRHKRDSFEFVFPSNEIYVIGSKDKPFKAISEGDPIARETDPMDSADASMGFDYRQKMGFGTIIGGYIGKYELA